MTLHPTRIDLGVLPDPAPGELRPIGVATARTAGWFCAVPGLQQHPLDQDVPRADWLAWAVFAEGPTTEVRERLLLGMGLDLGACGAWKHADAVAAANHVAHAVALARVPLEVVQAVTGRRRSR